METVTITATSQEDSRANTSATITITSERCNGTLKVTEKLDEAGKTWGICTVCRPKSEFYFSGGVAWDGTKHYEVGGKCWQMICTLK